jgi:glutathionyl-hydroquinone reductase
MIETLKHKMKHRVKVFIDDWISPSLQNPVFKRDFDRGQMSLGQACPWHADCNVERVSLS